MSGRENWKRVSLMSLVPVPEVRKMVTVAKQFVERELHFSHMVGPTEQCLWWAKVHGAHPAIIALAAEWHFLAGRVWNEHSIWNEHGQRLEALPVEEFRRRVAADLDTIAHG